jgi:HlyD family secretion protein
MNPRRLILPVVLIAGAAALFFFTREPGLDPDMLHGYAEGRYRMIAPDAAGTLVEVAATDGQHVEAGAVIARLDDARERAQLAQAQAAAEAAMARFDDAAAGGREPEIEAARELLAQARAAAEDANDELERVRPLFERGVVPHARLDAAEAAARQADARVAEMRERVTLAELPAREDALKALDADARAAESAVAVARDALDKRTLHAPSDGRIERVLRDMGETAGPTAPVARFLPDGDMLAVLFASEKMIGRLMPGTRLRVACDGCADGLSAVVSHIATDAEYTPPIIYSDRERARLVYRVEARFEGGAPPAGMPIEARIAEPAS